MVVGVCGGDDGPTLGLVAILKLDVVGPMIPFLFFSGRGGFLLLLVGD